MHRSITSQKCNEASPQTAESRSREPGREPSLLSMLHTKDNDVADQAYRIERDSMGEVRVPAGALYGAQTQRAVENFPISGLRFPRSFLKAIGMIKGAAAAVNVDLGLLPSDIDAAIRQSAKEVEDGAHDAHFPLDIFQTGSG